MKIRTLATFACFAYGLAGFAEAQSSVVIPSAYDRSWGRGSSSALGGSSTRTQMVFASPFPIGTPVFGFGLRATPRTTDRAGFMADIEVQISSSANPPGMLSSTFASNIGNDMMVALPRQMVNIAAMPANRSTGHFADILFPVPFVFGTNGNTNIVIDLFVHGRSAGAAWSTDRCFSSANGGASTAGVGCGAGTISTSSSGGTYVPGSTMTVTLANATANSIAWLIPSFDQKELLPGLPLPFDLAFIGTAPGCDLLVNLAFNPIGLLTDGAGAASISIPLGATSSVGTGWQWLYSVPPTASNIAGLETTASRKVRIGPEVCTGIGQYVWHLSNVNSATGTSTTDSVPIVKFILQ